MAIEAAIDAGAHIIASEGFKTPETFSEVFVVLGDNGFLPKEGVEPLREMAGFRNVLVHGYADVDDGPSPRPDPQGDRSICSRRLKISL